MDSLKKYIQYQIVNEENIDLKHKKLDIILKNNPVNNNLGDHTWIRTIDDILTYQEALDKEMPSGYEDLTPDFKVRDINKAINTNKITVYSSYPIKQGIFVTPSKMEAQNYAGSDKIYSKEVSLLDVAWIDPLQGQYAKVK